MMISNGDIIYLLGVIINLGLFYYFLKKHGISWRYALRSADFYLSVFTSFIGTFIILYFMFLE